MNSFFEKHTSAFTRSSIYYYAFAVNLGVAFIAIAKILIAFSLILNIFISLINSNKSLVKKFLPSYLCISIIIGLFWMNLTSFWSIGNNDEILTAIRRHDRLLFLPILYLLISNKKTALNTIKIIGLMQIFILFSSYLMLFGLNVPWAMPYIAVHFFNENPINYNHNLGILYTSTLEQPIMTAILFILLIQFRRIFKFLKSDIIFVLVILAIFVNIFYFMIGRSAYLGMIIVTTLALFYKLPDRLKKYSYLIPLVMFIIFTMSSSNFSARLSDSINVIKEFKFDNNNTAVGDRLDFLRSSIKIISNSPVIGVGIGGWKNAYLSFGGKEFNPPSNPHNQYLLWFSEGGVIGLIFLLLILLSFIKEGKKLNKTCKESINILTILIAILFSFNCLFFGAGLSDFIFIIIASILNLGFGINNANNINI